MSRGTGPARVRMVMVAATSLAALLTTAPNAASLARPSRRAVGAIAAATTPVDLQPIDRPQGASIPGTKEWYSASAPGGHRVTMGVYRPQGAPNGRSTVTILLLNGGDGFRRIYETLAERFANAGFTAVVGCWYEHAPGGAPDAIACANGPTWKGMNTESVTDVDALVAATSQIHGVHDHRIVVVGQSYGAGVALLRAATGRPEPVVSASGFLARSPVFSPPLPTDQFAAESAGSIVPAVLVIHGIYDPITPLAQAQAFVGAMPPSNPATIRFYDAPASHNLPWQLTQLNDRPGEPIWARFIEDVTVWIPTVWPTDPRVR